MYKLAAEPSVKRLASMPDSLLEMLEKTDPLRAQIVKDCRGLLEQNSPQS